MNNAQLEKLLLSARPRTQTWSPLTQSVMEQIRQRDTVSRQLHPTGRISKRNLFARLHALHGTSLLVAIVLTIVFVTGVAYAATQFLPDLIRVINKGVNGVGRIEYAAPTFNNCFQPGSFKTDTFEVLPTANLRDEEVERTLRAKCELMGMDTFASTTWPTYGEHKEWRDGDTIFYTRPDLLGTIVSVDKDTVIVSYSGGAESTKTYKTLEGQALQAFSRGQRINVSSIKPGDFVFSLVRVSETYHASGAQTTIDGISYAQPSDSPKVRGLVAVVKMSLPERYYTTMQQYVFEVRPCLGNTHERCTNGPIGPSIDVFPREGGEAAQNPHARTDKNSLEGYEINGTITAMTTESLTIKASSGTTYTIRAPKSLIDLYNTTYAPGYDNMSTDPNAVRVHTGSWISILYRQKLKEDHAKIALADIVRISLLTDIPAKQ